MRCRRRSCRWSRRRSSSSARSAAAGSACKIQQVTDEIAESLNLKPARGALVAGIDDKGPAKPAGIEAGDVIVKFDGKDIKEMRDLPRIVADTPVGKDVEVIIVRKGKEEKKTVKLGRLEDADKPVKASVDAEGARGKVGRAEVARPAAFRHDRRSAQEVQDQGLDQGRGDHRRRCRLRSPPTSGSPPAARSSRSSRSRWPAPADVQKKVDALKKAGKKTALLLVATAEGDMLFVALPIE